MKLSAILAPLIAAQVPHSVIMDAVLAFEQQQAEAAEVAAAVAEEGKEKARERWRRWKANHPSNVGKRLQTEANVGKQLTRVEDSSSKKEITGQEESKKAPAAPTPCQELETVLDNEHARAVVEHRQRLRKPLTAYAARKLATMLAKHPDPNAAADKMIESGWLKIEPDWGKPRSTSPPKKLTQSESLRNMAREAGIIDDTGTPIRRVESSDRDGENPGVGHVIQLAVAGNHRW